jgi:hypothetical protein
MTIGTTYHDTLPLWQKAIWDGDTVLNGGPAPRWSSDLAVPPPIGTRVRVNFNEFGYGNVVKYFIESGWLGVVVKIDKQPAWHLKQNGPDTRILCFGTEIELVPITTLDESFKEIEQ